MRATRFWATSSVVTIAMSFAVGQVPVLAAPAASLNYDLRADALGSALRTVGRLSGRQIMFSANAVAGRRAPALRGRFTADEAIQHLLDGSDLHASFTDDAVLIGGRPVAAASEAAPETAAQEILVTGSRITGAATASPLVQATAKDAAEAGQRSVAEMAAAIPQNFGGGQNPGVGTGVPGSANETSAATINLRGLGGAATLTLLNGHRVAYTGSQQSVDISNIPFLAVDRLEIVADGASALYGSDAVAGVANIILRERYDGLQTSARIGATSDGGDAQRQVDLIGGKSWSTGSIYGAYEFARNTAIEARQRSYARATAPGLTLFPSLQHQSGLVRLQQKIGSDLTFAIEGLYNYRHSQQEIAAGAAASYLTYGAQFISSDRSLVIAPSLKWDIAQSWRASVLATYATDHARYSNKTYLDQVAISDFSVCYCNRTEEIDGNLEGNLLSIGRHIVRLAVGAGYRRNTLKELTNGIDAHQDNAFAYGELNIPLVEPAQDLPLVKKLIVDVAARYEDYKAIGRVLNPKIGIIYGPFDGLDLKGSWGRSFKAPSLSQLYVTNFVALFPVAALGGIGYPSSATVLDVTGGNANLKPERASTYSFTAAFHPASLPAAQLEVTYFRIDYRNRIIAPIQYETEALSNPVYAEYVDLNPSAEAKAAAVARGTFVNITTGPYDPASVAAIVSNFNVNALRQRIRGVDLLGMYRLDMAGGASLRATGYASYIRSTQNTGADQPTTRLAGTLYNPPHFRARGGLILEAGAFVATTYFNYLGSVRDVRSSQDTKIGGMHTLDATLTYRPGPGAALAGFGFSLSASNITNAKPKPVQQTVQYFSPYDSTNYSPIGRQLSLTVSKRW